MNNVTSLVRFHTSAIENRPVWPDGDTILYKYQNGNAPRENRKSDAFGAALYFFTILSFFGFFTSFLRSIPLAI